MSFEATQRRQQHIRKIQRRIQQLHDQAVFCKVWRDSYSNTVWSNQIDYVKIDSLLGELDDHLKYCASRYQRWLDFLRGM